MPITQREYDIMQLQAQVRIMKLVDEWRRNFLKGRTQAPPVETPEDVEELPVEEAPYA